MDEISHETVEPLLTAKEVKRLLNCSLSLVYKMADRGQIPSVRWECPGQGKGVKTIVRFKLQDVIEFIERNYGISGGVKITRIKESDGRLG